MIEYVKKVNKVSCLVVHVVTWVPLHTVPLHLDIQSLTSRSTSPRGNPCVWRNVSDLTNEESKLICTLQAAPSPMMQCWLCTPTDYK